jgi:hypothetical protein
MPIYKLEMKGKDISGAKLIVAPKTNMALERHLEGCWNGACRQLLKGLS